MRSSPLVPLAVLGLTQRSLLGGIFPEFRSGLRRLNEGARIDLTGVEWRGAGGRKGLKGEWKVSERYWKDLKEAERA